MNTLDNPVLEITEPIIAGQMLCLDASVIAEVREDCAHMLTSANSTNEAAGRVFACQTFYLDGNLLARLGNAKSILSDQIVELKNLDFLARGRPTSIPSSTFPIKLRLLALRTCGPLPRAPRRPAPLARIPS